MRTGEEEGSETIYEEHQSCFQSRAVLPFIFVSQILVARAVDHNALEFRLGVRRLSLSPGHLVYWDSSFFVSTGLGQVIQPHMKLGVAVKVFRTCG